MNAQHGMAKVAVQIVFVVFMCKPQTAKIRKNCDFDLRSFADGLGVSNNWWPTKICYSIWTRGALITALETWLFTLTLSDLGFQFLNNGHTLLVWSFLNAANYACNFRLQLNRLSSTITSEALHWAQLMACDMSFSNVVNLLDVSKCIWFPASRNVFSIVSTNQHLNLSNLCFNGSGLFE